jgi:hypothetical protein
MRTELRTDASKIAPSSLAVKYQNSSKRHIFQELKNTAIFK